MGPSFPEGLEDYTYDSMIGNLASVHQRGMPTREMRVTESSVFGWANKISKPDYRFKAVPGLRTLWGFGGNFHMNEFISAMGQFESADFHLGSFIDAFVPLLANLHTGALVGVQSGAREGSEFYEEVDIPLEHLTRLRLRADVPDLPPEMNSGEGYEFAEVLLIAGALQYQQGLVPLGFSLGINQGFDAKQRGSGTGQIGEDGSVLLKMAPRHSGLEGRQVVALALSSNLAQVETWGSSSVPWATAGLMNYVPDTPLNNSSNSEHAKLEFTSNWLSPSQHVEINPETRTLSFDRVDGATFYRLQIGEHEQEWSLYFPQGSTPEQVLTIPELPEELSHRDPLSTAPITLHALSTNAGPGVSYKAMVEFNDRNMNNLLPYTSAYVSRKVR